MSETIFSTEIIHIYYKYRTVYTRQSSNAMLYAYVMNSFFFKLEDVTLCQGPQIIIIHDSAEKIWNCFFVLIKTVKVKGTVRYL